MRQNSHSEINSSKILLAISGVVVYNLHMGLLDEVENVQNIQNCIFGLVIYYYYDIGGILNGKSFRT